MAKSSNQKLKLLSLAEIFYKETDSRHGLSIDELIFELAKKDIGAQRKALYDDFASLEYFDMKISHYMDGKTPRYYLSERKFTISELKLLVDAVQSSKFISEKKSFDLIRKLENLTSVHSARNLRREVYTFGRIKTMNDSVFDNVDVIHESMIGNNKIAFQYSQWNEEKKEILRHNGKIYELSPWALIWNDENYYLAAYDSSEGIIKHFRVDKMRHIKMLSQKREGEKVYKEINPAKYTDRLFGMFNGDEITAALVCENRMAGVIIDRFGKNTAMVKVDENHFKALVDVVDSEQFLAWVISVGDGVKLTEPTSAVDKMKKLVTRLNNQYMNK